MPKRTIVCPRTNNEKPRTVVEVRDDQEGIGAIDWRNDGKIRAIIRAGSSLERNLTFAYDPSGNRLAKKVYNASGNLMYSNYYIRDASGNVMATYKSNIDTVAGSIVYTVGERHIYGSDRVGMYTYADTVYPVPPASSAPFKPVWRGHRKYELKNHLGNVTTVINGNKIPFDTNSDGVIDGFNAIIEAAYDYSPFGVTRKSFEPNYTAGTSGEVNPLAPDFRWCLDGDGIEAYGSGHDATLYNMITTSDRNNQSGSALESHGNADSYIEIQHHPDLVFEENDFTVGIWVKRLALNNNWNHTVAAGKWHSGQEPSQNEWYLAISNGGLGNNPPQFAIQSGGTKYTAGGTALPVGSWYHLVGVREGDYIKLYVDGTLVDTKYVGAAVVNTVPTRNIYLGLMGNGKFLKAGFDEFVVYHRALNATEVDELYGLGCADFEGEEGVLASGGYRYGFNGMEKDDEVKGKGNHVDFGARGYDPRLGRFFAVDPLSSKYPYYSPYAFSGNDVIRSIELEGLEPVPASEIWRLGKYTTASLTASDIDFEAGNKFAKIHGEVVLLINIKSGPNKGNYAGFTLGEGTKVKDFYAYIHGKNTEGIDAQLSYVVGADRVPKEALAGGLGAVATASYAKSFLSEYQYSSSLSGLTGVDNLNAEGQGYFSDITGEWISTLTTNSGLKAIGSNWLTITLDPTNYNLGSSHLLMKGKGSFSGMSKFKSDFKGTYRGSNRGNLSGGYIRSNPKSQTPIDVPIPDPASTEEIER